MGVVMGHIPIALVMTIIKIAFWVIEKIKKNRDDKNDCNKTKE